MDDDRYYETEAVRCETVKRLLVGMTVQLFEKGEVIDELKIVKISEGGCPTTDELTLESLKLTPGRVETFGFLSDGGSTEKGWRMLFEGLGGERCFSERAPYYSIRPVV